MLPVSEEEFKKFELAILHNDLSKLQPAERLEYYRTRCVKMGLDPVTQPFQLIVLNGKLVLYATKAATDQIVNRDNLSVEIVHREILPGDIYEVTVQVKNLGGRVAQNIGAVCTTGLKGEALCNAMMKAVTKAIRRTVLSFSGLGMLDETEVETIRDAGRVFMNPETGEVIDAPPVRALPAPPKQIAAPPPVAEKPAEEPKKEDPLAAAKAEILGLLKQIGREKYPNRENSAYCAGAVGGVRGFSEYKDEHWLKLVTVLRQAANDKKACFAIWAKLAGDPHDNEHRYEEWGTAVGRKIASSSGLAPAEWATLRQILEKAQSAPDPSTDPLVAEESEETDGQLFFNGNPTPGAFR